MDNNEDENFIITGAFDGSVKVWSYEGRNLESFYSLGEQVYSVCYVPATNAIWVSGLGMKIQAIDTRSWSNITEYVAEAQDLGEHRIARLARGEGDIVFGVSEYIEE